MEIEVYRALLEPRREIALRPERARTLGGLDLAAERQREILSALGFAPASRSSSATRSAISR